MPSGPNLFVVGAMKAGTTTLHGMLAAHPAVFMSEPKEPTHFVDGEELRAVSERAWAAGYWADRARYLDLFSTASSFPVRGESSTAYAKRQNLTGVAARIAAFNPEARILYLVRDPVERTLSHYMHAVRWNGEVRTPVRAFREDPHYVEVSHYAMQIRPYLEQFGRESVHVVTMEELRLAPAATLGAIFRWLGVDPDATEVELQHQNRTSTVVRPRGPEWLRRFRTASIVERLKGRVPWRVRTGMRKLLDEELERGSDSVVAAVRELRPRQQAETHELAELLDRDVSQWRRHWVTTFPPRASAPPAGEPRAEGSR